MPKRKKAPKKATQRRAASVSVSGYNRSAWVAGHTRRRPRRRSS